MSYQPSIARRGYSAFSASDSAAAAAAHSEGDDAEGPDGEGEEEHGDENDEDADDEDADDDDLDDPFKHVALPAIDDDHPGLVSDAAFDAMIDEIVSAQGGDANRIGIFDDDANDAADPIKTKKFYEVGDDAPWSPDNSWPEFDKFFAMLVAKGYSTESPNALPAYKDLAPEAMSTPDWARAVAAGNTSADDDEDEDADARSDGLDDPFAHVAKQRSEYDDDDYKAGDGDGADGSSKGDGDHAGGLADLDLLDLSYANKKRLFLEFSRDRPDIFPRLSERELYIIADHPMPPNVGHSSGRKQVRPHGAHTHNAPTRTHQLQLARRSATSNPESLNPSPKA